MRRRWPSVLKVGSTRFGPRKLIDLLSKAVEAEVHHSGDITLVIIHGRYTYTVRERTAVPEDAIAVIADEVVARELEYLINDSATAVERPLVIRALEEEQTSTDGLSYDTKLRKYRTAGDTQGATDSVATKTADRASSSINERLLDEANVEVWAGQILTPTLIETVSAQENVLINQAQVIKLVFDELAETNDSSSHNVASLVTSSVSEVGVVDGGVSATFSEAESYDISEVQASEDIPVGYVPQGGETLVIRAFADSVYVSDRLLYQKGALSTLTEEQASVDSISIEVGQATGTWPMFHHDPQHTGVADAHNVIYVGGYDHYLYAINPDGSLKWKYQTGDRIFSSPAVAPDRTIYVGSHDHCFYAINPDGSLKWKYQTGDYIYSSPAVAPDGTIYVGSYDHYLYAINPDGSLKWKYLTGNKLYSSPTVTSDGTIYVGSNDRNLYAINPDGSLKWKFWAGSYVYSSPAVAPDGTIYVGSYDHYLYAINSNGSLKWKYQTGDYIYSSPAVAPDGTIYVGSNDNYLYAINPDGSLKWKYQTGRDVYSIPAVAPDGTIYVGSNDSYLYAINPDGSLKWKFWADGYVTSSPAVAPDGTIYVGSDGRNLYALNPDGSLKWTYQTASWIRSSPAVV